MTPSTQGVYFQRNPDPPDHLDPPLYQVPFQSPDQRDHSIPLGQLGPALCRRSNPNVGSTAPKFAHIGSGKQSSVARGQACGPSVDNIMIAISYTIAVLALYLICVSETGASACGLFAPYLHSESGKGVSYCGWCRPRRHPTPRSWYQGGRAGPGPPIFSLIFSRALLRLSLLLGSSFISLSTALQIPIVE